MAFIYVRQLPTLPRPCGAGALARENWELGDMGFPEFLKLTFAVVDPSQIRRFFLVILLAWAGEGARRSTIWLLARPWLRNIATSGGFRTCFDTVAVAP